MANDPVVLSEKVRRPTARGLLRERLLRPLVAPESAATATVIALAGAGKSTLMAQAADQLGDAVAWYRATADDGTEAALVAHLAHALSAIGRLGDGSRCTGIAELVHGLDVVQGPATVIIDDVHEIAGTPAETALERFVHLRPGEVRVILGSRSAPSVNLPRLRVAGELAEVSGEDLRFRSWEVERLLHDVYGEPLPPETAAELTRKTGGWAAGLQLFHLATTDKNEADRRRAVTELDGRSQLIRSYLARNVLDEVAPELRRFLTRTCTLGLLTPALCDALLGTTRSAEILARLEQTQLFTSSDDAGRRYRYHTVLQVHLELALVEELGPVLTRELYARSAELLEGAGALQDALRAYVRAEDWGAVTRIGQNTFKPGAAPVAWEDIVPRRVRESDPWFAVAEARRRARSGAVSSAVAAYRRAEELMVEPAFLAQCAGERRLAAAWLPTGAAAIPEDGMAGDLHWIVRARLATRRIRDTAPRAGAPGEVLATALTRLLNGDLRGAGESFDAVVAAGDPGSFEVCAARLANVVVELLSTGRHRLGRELDAVVLAADFGGHAWISHVGGVLQQLLDGPDVARAGDQRADDDPWGHPVELLVRGIAREWSGADGTAELDDAAARFAALDAGVLEAWCAAIAALGLARRGDPAAQPRCGDAERLARRSGTLGALALASAARDLSTGGPEGADISRHVAALVDDCGIDRSTLLPSAPPAISPSDPVAPDVELRCLGGFDLRVRGGSVDLGCVRPRARALLRLLALTPDRDVHREAIVECLWPASSLAAGTRSLQVAVSSLRQVLDASGLDGHAALVRHGDAYRLALGPDAAVDHVDLAHGLAAARSLSAAGEPAAALAVRERALLLYAGDLLPEDGPADWVVEERDRLRLLAARGCVEQARDLRREHDNAAAVIAVMQGLRWDRFDDEAWTLLAELHEDSGNAAAGLLARREHAEVISELGLTDGAWPGAPVPVTMRVPRQPPPRGARVRA